METLYIDAEEYLLELPDATDEPDLPDYELDDYTIDDYYFENLSNYSDDEIEDYFEVDD